MPWVLVSGPIHAKTLVLYRWQAIQASGELRAMSRTHIHFASKPDHMRKNKWADTLLRLKLQVSCGDPMSFELIGSYLFSESRLSVLVQFLATHAPHIC